MREIVAWCDANHKAGKPFDVVLEGKTEDINDTDYVGAISEAGATWFIESRWDDEETPETLLNRIRKGPPVAS